MASGNPHLNYSIFDSSAQAVAVMQGLGNTLCYVNHAFCRLLHTSEQAIVGRQFNEVVPVMNECATVLDRVNRTGKAESHTEQIQFKPNPLYWSYEVWPLRSPSANTSGMNLAIQVTETSHPSAQVVLMNEALLVSAVRQQELVEETEAANESLRAELQECLRFEAEVEQLAYYDHLTDLANRRLLMDRLHQATVASCRTMQHGAILFIDLDRFKRLNDTWGHNVGDLLLQQLAIRLNSCVREDDTVARLGGDEFVIMLKDLSENRAEAKDQACKVAHKVLDLLSQPYILSEQEYRCTASIGITVFGNARETVTELLSRADLAQYRAKSAGGNAVQSFDQDMEVTAAARAVLEKDLRHALDQNQFLLFYQSILDGGGHVVGVEGLLRWQHPQRGILSPAEFIELAEEHQIISYIGQWVLKTASRQLVAWSLKPETSNLTIAINVSAAEFGNPTFVSQFFSIVDDFGADPTKLVLELTERVMFTLDETVSKMTAMKARGVCFSLDDFGMGFSSLACLKHLPISMLKIDRSFIKDILVNSTDDIIVNAVIELAHRLGLSVVAEGVETEGQFISLSARGCDLYQGFLFGDLLGSTYYPPTSVSEK